MRILFQMENGFCATFYLKIYICSFFSSFEGAIKSAMYLSRTALVVQFLSNVFVDFIGSELERQIFQLRFYLVQAQAMCHRRIEIRRFAGDSLLLLFEKVGKMYIVSKRSTSTIIITGYLRQRTSATYGNFRHRKLLFLVKLVYLYQTRNNHGRRFSEPFFNFLN